MNEIAQLSFDYSTLPADVATEAKMASERIKLRLKRTAEDIVEIGRELVAIKEKIGHGNFLPWIEAEFEMSRPTALRFMQAFEKFGGKSVNLTFFKPSIIYELSAPSTPEAVITQAIENAESGEKVTVADVQKWKREAEILANRAKALDQDLQVSRNKVRALESRKPETVIKTVEVAPPDYEDVKRIMFEKSEELVKAKEARDAAIKSRDKLMSEQENIVNSRVKSRMDAFKKDVEIMDARVNNRQKELEEIEKQLATMNRKLSEVSWHEDIIKKHWAALTDLSIDIADVSHNSETSARWFKLATGFLNAAKAIKQTMCDGQPMDEAMFNALSES